MIKEANILDYEQICNLGEYITKDFKKLYSRDSLFNDYTKILVYINDVEILGFIHYEILYETVNILNIVVNPNHRRKKIATKLLDSMLSDLCNKNIEHIMLEVNEKNIEAINLYKKFNFEIINIRKKYYNGKDAYIMERRVK